MKNSGSSTHRPRAVPPKDFRDQATGIGASCETSRYTGAARNARVGSAMPPAQRAAAPEAEGFDKSVPYQPPMQC